MDRPKWTTLTLNPKRNLKPQRLKPKRGPVDPSFRALSGRLKFTVRRHKFNKDSLSTPNAAAAGDAARAARRRDVRAAPEPRTPNLTPHRLNAERSVRGVRNPS